MSILIKGMEMPESCDTCFLSKWDTCNERFYCMFDDCPLIEVPAPHGRLIDYGWVVENVIKKLGIKDKQYLLQAEKALMILVDEAPTVIEAEGTE